jgi:hypothetical protein
VSQVILAQGAVDVHGVPPQVLCAQGLSLFHGQPTFFDLGYPGTANLIIDDSRIRTGALESLGLQGYQYHLYREQIASLSLGTNLLAIPGSYALSVEDAILQIGPDIVLLQGSVTDDNRYILRRIGTTLAEEVSRRLFLNGLDGLLDLEKSQRTLYELGLPLSPTGGLIVDRSNRGRLDFTGAYGVYYR